MTNSTVFLTAEWRYLVMLNYEVEPALLRPYVPPGTELDDWQGATFLSLVGLLFRDTRVLGLAIPFHRNFPELNLRCYVRYQAAEGWRRGVVFIKEIVPKAAVALAARLIYNENYVSLPMRLDVDLAGEAPHRVTYSWSPGGQPCRLSAQCADAAAPPAPGSLEDFITEHYWGYAAQRGGGTLQYQVEHPTWPIWQAAAAEFSGDVSGLYGPALAAALAGPPRVAFVADGSPVTVYQGKPLV